MCRKRRCPVARAGTQVYRDPRSRHLHESPEGQTRLPSFCRGLRRDKDKGRREHRSKACGRSIRGRALGTRFNPPSPNQHRVGANSGRHGCTELPGPSRPTHRLPEQDAGAETDTSRKDAWSRGTLWGPPRQGHTSYQIAMGAVSKASSQDRLLRASVSACHISC